MRRGSRKLSKSPTNFEGRTRGTDKKHKEGKKVRKSKEVENLNRCQSDEGGLRESGRTTNTPRTRSTSPVPLSPRPNIDLPLGKFYKVYSRIAEQLETVKDLTESKSKDPENLQVLRRQLQRADEFSIRFSRNNLYETKRILSEVKKIVVPCPFGSLTTSESRLLCKKIITGFQAASQSLQYYINHVKNPVNLDVPEKIKELVLLIADLFLCCEHLCLPTNDVYIQNDAVKMCNGLIAALNSKVSVTDNSYLKEVVCKKTTNVSSDDAINKLSMYKTKLKNPVWKGKSDVSKKKFGVHGLLGQREKRLRKKDDRKARITHEIYTQKMSAQPLKTLGSKVVKFEPVKMVELEKGDSLSNRRQNLKRLKYFTPREVRSQDDDVETMVQAIGNDDMSTSRPDQSPPETDEGSEGSSNFNKSSFRELLLEAIQELQSTDKKEQKVTLKKLLNSIQNCSRSQNSTPRTRVKVYHFKSADMEKEEEEEVQEKVEEKSKCETEEEKKVDLAVLHKEMKDRDEILAQPRRLKVIFKPLKQKRCEGEQKDVMPKGIIQLNLPEEFATSANKYKKAFAEYRRNNIMYKKALANRPWDLVAKISDRIIQDILTDISSEFENDELLRRLYLNELFEVAN